MISHPRADLAALTVFTEQGSIGLAENLVLLQAISISMTALSLRLGACHDESLT